MGFGVSGLRTLLYVTATGGELGSIATMGRQELMLTVEDCAGILAAESDLSIARPRLDRAVSHPYCESLLYAMGARQVTSFDMGAHEGADVLLDLNLPVPAEYHARFDTLIDFGTLEHLFDIPQVLRNYMSMIRPGGRLVLETPANNWLGHGFYQFSPELFFRVLNSDNGFSLDEMFAHRWGPSPEWYLLSDPAALEERVEVRNHVSTLLSIIATKCEHHPPLQVAVQQSDYASTWKEERIPAKDILPRRPIRSRRGGVARLAQGAARRLSGALGILRRDLFESGLSKNPPAGWTRVHIGDHLRALASSRRT